MGHARARGLQFVPAEQAGSIRRKRGQHRTCDFGWVRRGYVQHAIRARGAIALLDDEFDMQRLALRDAEQVEATSSLPEVDQGVRRRSLHAIPLLKSSNATPITAVECLKPLGQRAACGRV